MNGDDTGLPLMKPITIEFKPRSRLGPVKAKPNPRIKVPLPSRSNVAGKSMSQESSPEVNTSGEQDSKENSVMSRVSQQMKPVERVDTGKGTFSISNTIKDQLALSLSL